MPADKLKPLKDQFGGPLPAGLSVLSAADAKDLAAALVEAERVQTAELDRAIDHTLRFLPWPLNGIVRKILIG
jgi:hypothetical protein